MTPNNKRRCINCKHRLIKGASDFCLLDGHLIHYDAVYDLMCDKWMKAVKPDYKRGVDHGKA